MVLALESLVVRVATGRAAAGQSQFDDDCGERRSQDQDHSEQQQRERTGRQGCQHHVTCETTAACDVVVKAIWRETAEEGLATKTVYGGGLCYESSKSRRRWQCRMTKSRRTKLNAAEKASSTCARVLVGCRRFSRKLGV